MTAALAERAAVFACLGDPARLAICDELALSDRSPSELGHVVGLNSSLLAHHLEALEAVGLVVRTRSHADMRRRYVRLVHERISHLGLMVGAARIQPRRALFVCTQSSARSPLAAAVWRQTTGQPADSAGNAPASTLHPGAVAAAKRAGLDLGDAVPRSLASVHPRPKLVITVCDRAHEEHADERSWLHWSIPDPAADGRPAAFDAVVAELRHRIETLVQVPA
jgi:ArsR family transcriptional regulator, arsenate/arsenite/antimonite-responsive transcriptional repressor / arsenate reductase (thioredoxin)